MIIRCIIIKTYTCVTNTDWQIYMIYEQETTLIPVFIGSTEAIAVQVCACAVHRFIVQFYRVGEMFCFWSCHSANKTNNSY